MQRSYLSANSHFRGAATHLLDTDLPRVGELIGVGEDEIHAVLEVEALGKGFDKQGRPKMLFEPHIFYREISKAQRDLAVQKGLARRKWARRYPKDSYLILRQAMLFDRVAALRSASWGLGQVMGFNHELAGYESVDEMVLAFMQSEGLQLQGMINFIRNSGLDDELRNHQWSAFARGYNGAKYAVNRYHLKLARAYEKWRKIPDTAWKKKQLKKVILEESPEEPMLYDGH